MIRINLLAEAKPAKKKRGVAALGAGGRLNTILLGAAIGLAVIVGAIQYWILSTQIRRENEKIRVAQVEVARLESVLKEVKDYEAKKARVQRKVDLINQLKQNQRGPVRLMDEISRALPDLVWLEKMEAHGNAVSMTGKAFNPPAVANFLENLKRVPSFQEPKVEFSACAGPGNVSLYCFRMNFVFSNIDRTAPEVAGVAPAKPASAGGT